jgi:hypothetical protein
MQCPECQLSITHIHKDGMTRYYCPRCLWGKDHRTGPRIWPRILLFWLISIIITVAFYGMVRLGIPKMDGLYDLLIGIPADDYVPMLNRHFWWIFGIYVLIGSIMARTQLAEITTEIEEVSDPLFLFMNPLHRNLVKIELAMISITLCFYPGTIVFLTIRDTVKVIFNKIRSIS